MTKKIDESLFSKGTLNELEMMELKGGEVGKTKPNCSCTKTNCGGSCPTNINCPSCPGIVEPINPGELV
ncbi:MAG: hypothetical protein LBU51_09815 [Bacteroidales bacterium]|jgi:hypothetical protein|nr:hypothetical protein [Bacteroidales bacterium]